MLKSTVGGNYNLFTANSQNKINIIATQNNILPASNINGILSVYKPPHRISSPFLYDLQKKLWASFCNSHPLALEQKIPFELNLSSRKISSVLGRIGHGGTLDPMAQGILVVGLGRGTKMLGVLLKGPKSYLATMKLGETTNTLDITGTVTAQSNGTLPNSLFDRLELEKVVKKFVGNDILQVPPKFSALRIHGIRACELMRKGEDVPELQARPITIKSILITDINPPFITIHVDCLGGTYIRSLVRDIATELGTYGTLTFLERISVGPFSLKDTIYDLSIVNDLNQVQKLANHGTLILSEYTKNSTQSLSHGTTNDDGLFDEEDGDIR